MKIKQKATHTWCIRSLDCRLLETGRQ